MTPIRHGPPANGTLVGAYPTEVPVVALMGAPGRDR
jgi:hypothetical protein